MKNDYSFVYESMKQENTPALDEQKKREHKKQFLEMTERQNFEMSDMQFLIGQFRFIKKRTWLLQLVVIVAAICYMKIILHITFSFYPEVLQFL